MSGVKVTYPVLSKSQVIDRLREACVNLARRLPISKVILFGSYASGNHTAGSDIDIVVVYRGGKRDSVYNLVMNEIRLPRLEPRICTEEEFNALMTNGPRFADVLKKEGIVIVGSDAR